MAPIQLHPTYPPKSYPITILGSFHNTIKLQTTTINQETDQIMHKNENFKVEQYMQERGFLI